MRLICHLDVLLSLLFFPSTQQFSQHGDVESNTHSAHYMQSRSFGAYRDDGRLAEGCNGTFGCLAMENLRVYEITFVSVNSGIERYIDRSGRVCPCSGVIKQNGQASAA